jgi:hypothetical protein
MASGTSSANTAVTISWGLSGRVPSDAAPCSSFRKADFSGAAFPVVRRESLEWHLDDPAIDRLEPDAFFEDLREFRFDPVIARVVGPVPHAGIGRRDQQVQSHQGDGDPDFEAAGGDGRGSDTDPAFDKGGIFGCHGVRRCPETVLLSNTRDGFGPETLGQRKGGLWWGVPVAVFEGIARHRRIPSFRAILVRPIEILALSALTKVRASCGIRREK